MKKYIKPAVRLFTVHLNKNMLVGSETEQTAVNIYTYHERIDGKDALAPTITGIIDDDDDSDF